MPRTTTFTVFGLSGRHLPELSVRNSNNIWFHLRLDGDRMSRIAGRRVIGDNQHLIAKFREGGVTLQGDDDVIVRSPAATALLDDLRRQSKGY